MRRWWVMVAAVVIVVSTGGCGMPEENSDEQVRAELMARPSLESALAGVDAMVAEIRQRWEDELGIDGWSTDGKRNGSGCGLSDMWDVGERDTGMWRRDGPIPENKWLRARAIVGEVGVKYGFESPFAIVSKPGIHSAYAHGPFGAGLSFGSGVNVTINARTGCHPLAAVAATSGG